MRTLTPRIVGEARRRRERDLFCNAKWSGDGRVAVYDVAKPGYRPVRPRRVEMGKFIAGLLGKNTCPAGHDKDAVPQPLASEPSSPKRNWFEQLFE